MGGRQGGKLKPMKAPKKADKADEDPDDADFKAKQIADKIKLKAAQVMASKSGPLVGGGIKKSAKK